MKVECLQNLFLLCAILLSVACGGESISAEGDAPTEVPAGAEPAAQVACIDPDQVDPMRICTMDYNPVCGCDEKTYSNRCVAGSAGVTDWRQGACADSE